MVRTFPEAGLVFFAVHAAVLTEAPEPFPVLFVYQVCLYEFIVCMYVSLSQNHNVIAKLLLL
jgi:hypothetical protein